MEVDSFSSQSSETSMDEEVEEKVSPPPVGERHLLDFGPAIRPSFGVVSPDLLGKCTLALLCTNLVQFLPTLECKMHFKQNRTQSDGTLSYPALRLKDFEVEVKWSTIQLQANRNSNKKIVPNYYRWEFGNIHPKKFNLIVLFGHHALQATATETDAKRCKTISGRNVVWNAEPTDLEGWLRSVYIWIYPSSHLSSRNLHCTFGSSRGAYNKQGSEVKLSDDMIWGGDLPKVAARLQKCLQECIKKCK